MLIFLQNICGIFKNRSLPLNGIILVVVIWSPFFINPLWSQHGVVSSGGKAQSSEGTISYSIGQIVYKNHISEKGQIFEGLQHAFEIFTVEIVDPVSEVSITLFPNPAINHLTLKFTDIPYEMSYYQMYNLQGQLISVGFPESQETSINFYDLIPGTYLISVYISEKPVKVFKVVKN